jgi:putative DNA primase/helicase
VNITMSKSSGNRGGSNGQATRTYRTYAPGERVFLAVPSKEVPEALKLGAKWDRPGRVCWIHVNADRAPFARWIVDDAALNAAGMNKADVIADFQDAMKSYGLVPVDPVTDGQWHCAPLTTDKGSKIHQTHGGYRLSLDGVPHGAIRNFKGRSGTWRYQGGRLSRVQLAAVEAQNKEREVLRQQQVEVEQKAVADSILQILVPLAQAAGHVHGYLTKKGVRAHGLRIADGRTDDMAGLLNMPKFKPGNAKWLVIPGRDVHDNLLTAQAIDPKGNKVFASGARKKGAFHVKARAGSPLLRRLRNRREPSRIHEPSGRRRV